MAVATPVKTKRTAVSYKVAPQTRRRGQLLAASLGLDQSEVIDQAIAKLTAEKRAELNRHVREVQASLDAALEELTPSEILTGLRRRR